MPLPIYSYTASDKNKFNFMLTILMAIFSQTLLATDQQCLLPLERQSVNKTIDSIAPEIGFWFQFLPLIRRQNLIQTDLNYGPTQSDLPETGDLLFVVAQDANANPPLIIFFLDYTTAPGITSLNFLYLDQSTVENSRESKVVLTKLIPTLWYFLHLRLTTNEPQSNLYYYDRVIPHSLIGLFRTTPTSKFWLLLAGQGELQLGYSRYAFRLFSGRLSRLFLLEELLGFSDADSPEHWLQKLICFTDAQSFCIKEQKEILISKALYYERNHTVHSAYLHGAYYQLSFWLNLDRAKASRPLRQFILRGTINTDYSDEAHVGDRMFLLRALTYYPSTELRIEYSLFSYKTPDPESLDFRKDTFLAQPNYNQGAFYSPWLKIGIYQMPQGLYLEQSNGFNQGIFLLDEHDPHRFQFTEATLSLYIGQDKFNYDRQFIGWIKDMQIVTCIPPSAEQKSIGAFNQTYNIQFSEIPQKGGGLEFGHFKFQGQSFKCPHLSFLQQTPNFQQKAIHSCLDCLLDPNWGSSLECRTAIFLQMLYSQLDGPILAGDNKEHLQNYFIAENSIFLCVGCRVCQSLDDQACFLREINSTKVRVKCLEGYKQAGIDCVLCSENCLKCDGNSNCLKCYPDFAYDPIKKRCMSCPRFCLSCSYDQSLGKVACTKCFSGKDSNTYLQSGYTIFNGECVSCSLYCISCQFVFDPVLKIYVENCLACLQEQGISEKNYYYAWYIFGLNYDGRSCVSGYDIIDFNCQLPFFYNINDRRENTLNLNGVLNVDSSQIRAGCAKCITETTYVNSLGKCIYEGLTALLSYKEDETSETIILSGDPYDSTEAIESGKDCTINGQVIEHCVKCILSNTYKIKRCTLCEIGFYAHRFSGICESCQIANCKVCIHQDKVRQDGYKQLIRPFYEFFVNSEGDMPFEVFAQSQKEEEYEVVCRACLEEYVLKNGECLTECSERKCYCDQMRNCLYCVYSDQVEGFFLTLTQKKCIECPMHCKMCVEIDSKLKSMINPYFTSTKYGYFSNFCIEPGVPQDTFWDEQLRQFVKCRSQAKCESEMIIQRTVICSKIQYDAELIAAHQRGEEAGFLNSFVHLAQIFEEQGKGFDQSNSKIANDDIYLLANRQQVKRVRLLLNIPFQDSCIIPDSSVASQLFSQNIFTAIEVHLELSGENSNLFIQGKVTVANFTSVTLRNLTLTCLNLRGCSNLPQVFFDSLLGLTINIWNVTLHSTNLQFVLLQPQVLDVVNLTIKNYHAISSKGIFVLASKRVQGTLATASFKGIAFEECYFAQSSIFSIETLANTFFLDSASFYKSTINESVLAQSQSSAVIDHLVIDRCSIVNSQGFIQNHQRHLTLEIANLSVANSFFSSTILLLLNGITLAREALFNNLTLTSDSHLVGTNGAELLKNVTVQISGAFFYLIELCPNCKLMNFARNQLRGISLELVVFDRIVFSQPRSRLQVQELAHFDAQHIRINNLSLYYQGDGLIHFQNSLRVEIQQMKIELHEEFRFRLEPALECLKSPIDVSRHSSILSFLNVNNLTLDSVRILHLRGFNDDLIVISNQGSTQQSLNSILLTDFVVSRIIQIASNQANDHAILSITSNQIGSIALKRGCFTRNHIHQFEQIFLDKQNAYISINCEQCQIQLEDFQFEHNFLSNSTSSLIYLFAAEIQVKNSKFTHNNVVLGPQQDSISTNQVEPSVIDDYISFYFPVNTTKGCINLKASLLHFNKVKIQDQSSKSGRCAYFESFGISKLDFIDVHIENIVAGQNASSNGACFHFILLKESFSLKISSSSFHNIQGQSLGGVLYLYAAPLAAYEILIVNSSFSLVMAYQGSLIYAYQEDPSLTGQSANEIIISNSTIKTYTLHGLYDYLMRYKLEVTELSTFRSLIRVQSANVLISGVHIYELIFESLLWQTQGSLRISSLIIDKISPFYPLISSNYMNEGLMSISLSLISINGQAELDLQSLCQRPSEFNFVEENSLLEMKKCNLQLTRISSAKKSANSPCSIIQSVESYYDAVIVLNGQNIIINQVTIQNIQNPIFSLQLGPASNLRVSHLILANNSCDATSCFLIKYYSTHGQFSPGDLSGRKGTIQISNMSDAVVTVEDFDCYLNRAKHGPCLFLERIDATIFHSRFINNSATETGGAVYLSGSESNILIKDSIFIENNAATDCAIYKSFGIIHLISGSTYIECQPLGSPIKLIESPSILSIQLGTISSSQYDEVINEQELLIGILKADSVFMPSSGILENYRIFNPKTETFLDHKLIFRVFAQNQFQQTLSNLTSTFCEVSFLINPNLDKGGEHIIKGANQGQKSWYNPTLGGYEFPKLKMSLKISESQQQYLTVYCNSILQASPSKNQSSQRFHLLIKVIPFQCQFGEFHETASDQCQLCDFQNGKYSLSTQRTTTCKAKNDDLILNVKEGFLDIKMHFWRPNLYNDDIEYCKNRPTNCLGNLKVGQDSCLVGHIGALCESCDLHNVRGGGQFSQHIDFQCDSCFSILWFGFISTYIFLSCFLGIMFNFKSSQRFSIGAGALHLAQFASIQKIALLESVQFGVLFKLLQTHIFYYGFVHPYFLSSYSNYQYITAMAYNPLQFATNTLDCLLQSLPLKIIYSRVIGQILYPFSMVIVSLPFTFLQLAKFKSVCFIIFVNSYFYFSPFLLQTLIQLIAYRTISSIRWMAADTAYLYDETVHLHYVTPATIGCIVIITLIPITALCLFKRLIRFLGKQRSVQLASLIMGFKSPKKYWELIRVVFVLLLKFIDVILINQMFIRSLSLFFLLEFYLVLIQRNQPHMLNSMYRLEKRSLKISQISILLSQGIFQLKPFNTDLLRYLWFFAIHAIQITFMLHLQYLTISSLIDQMQEKLDQLKERLKEKMPSLLNKFPSLGRFLINRSQLSTKSRKNFRNLVRQVIATSEKIKSKLASRSSYRQRQDQSGCFTFSFNSSHLMHDTLHLVKQ